MLSPCLGYASDFYNCDDVGFWLSRPSCCIVKLKSLEIVKRLTIISQPDPETHKTALTPHHATQTRFFYTTAKLTFLFLDPQI